MWKIELIHGSCADQEVDVVVNAANRYLAAGGGICGVIFKKAGMKELVAACQEHKTPLKDGEAVITPAFGLKNAKAIIHAVGPDFGSTPKAFKELYEAYYNSLMVMKGNGYHSISFPLISAGIFGGNLPNPVEESTKQCCRAYKKFCEDCPEYEVEVKLCAYSDKEHAIAKEVLLEQNPPEENPEKKDYEGEKICIKERQDGSAILYTQDIDDFINAFEGEDGPQTISVYRFNAENWKKLKETLNAEDPVGALFHKFFWTETVMTCFMTDDFQSFCSEHGVDFEFSRTDCIWFQPEKETFGAMFKQLCMYEENDGYKIPDEYPDRRYPQPKEGYWPIKVDMKNKIMTEVQGVTACAGYCSKNVLMTFSEIEGFYL